MSIINDLKQIRLFRQHLTEPADKLTVCRDLNGLQAQFMVNVYYALKVRCKEEITPENFGDGLVKNWTVRGTVHAFAKDDLALFLNGEIYRSNIWRGYVYRPIQDWAMTPEQQKYFSELIVKKVSEGVCTREDLKAACMENGMPEDARDSMFDSWGGGLRELCERGYLCYKVQEKKEFMLCPDFQPMEREAAELETARRYFANFAPATIRDFAYYLGCTQTRARQLMSKLPLDCVTADGRDYFYLGTLEKDYPDIPRCILLAGFDQLMLGYKKEESIFLPREHLRGIFNLAGIVMPPVLLNGRVVGRWRKKNKKVTFELFEPVSAKNKKYIEDLAEHLYCEIQKIEWTCL